MPYIGNLVHFKGGRTEAACFGVITKVEEDGVIVAWPIPDSAGDTEDWYRLDDEGRPIHENDKIVFIKDKQ